VSLPVTDSQFTVRQAEIEESLADLVGNEPGIHDGTRQFPASQACA